MLIYIGSLSYHGMKYHVCESMYQGVHVYLYVYVCICICMYTCIYVYVMRLHYEGYNKKEYQKFM